MKALAGLEEPSQVRSRTTASTTASTDDRAPRPEAFAEPSLGLKRRALRPRTLLSFSIPIVVLLLVAKRIAGIDLGDVWEQLHTASPGLLLLAIGVFYLSVLVRTLRWRTLLDNIGYSRAAGYRLPSLAGLSRIVLLASFTNSITTGQLGDALRGYFLGRATPGISFTATLGTIVAERLLDVVVLMALLSASSFLAFGGVLPAVATQALAGGVVLAVLGLVGLFSLRSLRPLITRYLPERWQAQYVRFEQGTRGSLQRLPLLLACTAAGWAVEGFTIYFAALAVGAGLSLPGAFTIAMLASLLGVVSLTPGGLGVTEAAIVVVLGTLGIDSATAGAIAVLNRVINYWSITLVGGVLYLSTKKNGGLP